MAFKRKSIVFRSLRAENGFSILEAVIASIIIAFIGLAVAHSFLNFTMASMWNRQAKKASVLGDMAFERYAIYASTDFGHLSSYQVTNSSAIAFFQASDNLGFDDFKITSLVQSVPNKPGLKKIEITILAPPLGGHRKDFHFFKYVSPVNTSGDGALVNVYVRQCVNPPVCDDPSGPPIAGANVSAPPFVTGGSNVTGVTDANGLAPLENVKLGTLISITADKAGDRSDVQSFTVPDSQGYYVDSGGGVYAVEDSTVTSVKLRGLNQAVLTRFQPSVAYSGVVANNAGGPTDGMIVRFHARGSDGNSIVDDYTFDVTTQGNKYTIYNLLPGPLKIQVLGRCPSGSCDNVAIPPSAPNFQQAYAGDNSGLNPNPNNVVTTLAHPFPVYPLTLPGPVLYVHEEGPVTLTVKDSLANPVQGVKVKFTLPGDGFRQAAPIEVGPTDAAGQIALGNVVPNTMSIAFKAYQLYGPACGTPPYGYFGEVSATGNYGTADNPIPISVSNGHRVSGNTVKLDYSAMQGIDVTGPALDGSMSLTTTSHGSGADFEICGVAPTGNQLMLLFSDSNPVNQTFNGHLVRALEQLHGQEVVGAKIVGGLAGSCPGSGDAISGSGGYFPTFCKGAHYQALINFTLADPSVTDFVLGPIPLHDNIADLPLEATAPYFGTGSSAQVVTMDSSGLPIASLPLPGPLPGSDGIISMPLTGYPVTGTVTDADTGNPVGAGVLVGGGLGSIPTGPNGVYHGSAAVLGRNTSSDGMVYLTAGPGTDANGVSYGASGPGVAAVPANPDFFHPLVVDLQVPIIGSGM